MLAFLFAMLSTLPPKRVPVNIYIEHSYNKVGLINLRRQHMYTKNKYAKWKKIEGKQK